MITYNDSCLLNECDCTGMTDNQYKGMLLDQLKSWKQVLELAVKSGNTEIEAKVNEEIAVINEKLKI